VGSLFSLSLLVVLRLCLPYDCGGVVPLCGAEVPVPVLFGGGVAPVSGDALGSFGEALGVVGVVLGTLDGELGVTLVAPGSAVLLGVLVVAFGVVVAVPGVCVVALGIVLVAFGVVLCVPGAVLCVPGIVLCAPGIVLCAPGVLCEPIAPALPCPAPADWATAQHPHNSNVPVKIVNLRFMIFASHPASGFEMAAPSSDGYGESKDARVRGIRTLAAISPPSCSSLTAPGSSSHLQLKVPLRFACPLFDS
jgi:hypothetical protein